MFFRHKYENYSNQIDDVKFACNLSNALRTFILFDDPNVRRTRRQPIKWNIYRIFFFVIILTEHVQLLTITTCFMSKSSSKSAEVLNRLGDVIRFLGGPPNLIAIGNLITYFITVTMAITVTKFSMSTKFRQVLIEVYKPIKVISGQLEPNAMGLTVEDLKNLRIHSKILFDFLYRPSNVVSFGLLMYLIYIFGSHIDIYADLNRAIFSLTTKLITMKLCLSGMAIALVYFHITCQVLKLRIKNWNFELSNVRSRGTKSITIRRVLSHHNDIVVRLYRLNKFWSKYAFAIYLTYLPVTSLLIFLTIMADLSPILFYLVVLSIVELLVLLTFACLSAGGVSRDLMKTQKSLAAFRARGNFKNKVLQLKFLRMMLRFEKQIGFQVLDCFVVTSWGYFTVSWLHSYGERRF